VIYGALPPEVRRREAERFATGASHILVATDAIGMGLNLPIRRVLFSTLSQVRRPGRPHADRSEVHQIAGRAGRYGIHEEGFVGVLAEPNPAPARCCANCCPRSRARRATSRRRWRPTGWHVDTIAERLGVRKLREVLGMCSWSSSSWTTRTSRWPNWSRCWSWPNMLDRARRGLTLKERFIYAQAPVDTRTDGQVQEYLSWSRQPRPAPARPAPWFLDQVDGHSRLDRMEQALRACTLWLWLDLRFPKASTAMWTKCWRCAARSTTASSASSRASARWRGLGWDLSERGRFDQLKSEFISTVSHELRTPLTAITGALGLLRGGACGDLGEAAQPMLEIAHKNSLRLGHLINDLLDMERLASDRLRLDLHVQALMPLVDKAIELAQGFARENQVEFRLSARADGAEVRVDAERLRQVMVHFLSNAAKFSPRGSQVELRVSCADGAARVEVIDHGCGIPEHFRGRIFQKFSQADSSDTRQKGGTGLGLAICKGLIERMNGLIGFESTPGVGTRFHFQLPLMRQAARAAPFGGLSLPGAPLVLVVEDEPDIAQLIVLMLNRAGLGAEVAGTALEAVERLQEGGVAAMTLDLLLPDQSGLALMQHIRELPGFRQLPVVVVSAFIEDGRHSLSRELEPIDWIPKPIDEGRLIQALRTGLERLANKSQP
jgi:signal transduction histidine kinase/CheY-like chemotaxis protein